MPRTACLLGLLVIGTAHAAPVPKEKPETLPDGALARLGSTRFRGLNTDGVTFSKDGKTLYATDDKNTVLRWDTETGKPLEPITFDVKAPICSRVRGDRAFVVEHTTPGGPAHDSIVHIFDLPSGRSRGKFDPKEYIRFTQSRSGLHRVDISADGERFAVHSHNGRAVRVFDTSGDEPTEISPSSPRGNVLLSPEGGRVLVTDEPGSTVIDLKDGKALCTIPSEIPNAAFSPDGSKLIGYPWIVERNGNMTKKSAGRLTVWDANTGKALPAPEVEGYVWQFAYLSADSLLVGRSTKEGPEITRRNLKTGKEEWSAAMPFVVPTYDKCSGEYCGVSGPLPVFAVSPDGKRVAVSDRFCRIALFDATNGNRLNEDAVSHPAEVQWVSLSADGKTAVTASNHDIREWDAATGELKAVFAPPELAQARFAGATKDLLVWSVCAPPKLQPWALVAWDRKANKVAWKFTPDVKYVWEVRTTEESVVVGVAEASGGVETIRVYDAAGKMQHEWHARESYRNAFRPGLSNDSLWQYVDSTPGSDKAKLVGRSLQSGKSVSTCEHDWPKDFSGISLVAPSPDGKRMGLGSYGGDWVVFETAGGSVLSRGSTTRIIPDQSRNVLALPFSPDGKKLLVHTNHHPLVQVAELKMGGKTWTLDGKGAAASAVAFSQDGKKVVAGYRDGTALIWDLSK